MNAKNITLITTVIITGLSAGLFYGWVVSVIPGTKKLTDQAYLETMQSINKEILNPAFFIVFFGAIILLIASSFIQYRLGVTNVFYLTLGAMLVYLIGTLGVTMFGNVPLNNVLESHQLSTFSAIDFKHARDAFESSWNNLNMIRTLSAILSFILILIATLKK